MGICFASRAHLALAEHDAAATNAAVEMLAERGPIPGRPIADTLSGSSLANLKELRPTTSLRVLFVFDPRRTAILLIGLEELRQAGLGDQPREV